MNKLKPIKVGLLGLGTVGGVKKRSFGEFLSSRVLKQSDRSRSIRAMFEGKVHDLTLKFLLVLLVPLQLSHF